MSDPCETCTEHKLIKSDIAELKETKKYISRLFLSTVLSILTAALAMLYTFISDRGKNDYQEIRRRYTQAMQSENNWNCDTCYQPGSVRDSRRSGD